MPTAQWDSAGLLAIPPTVPRPTKARLNTLPEPRLPHGGTLRLGPRKRDRMRDGHTGWNADGGRVYCIAPGRPPAPPAAAPPAPPLRQQYLTLRHQQWWCMAQASALVWRARLRLAAAQAPGCVPILLLAGPRFYPTDPGRPL
jgi:hypothetical protein